MAYVLLSGCSLVPLRDVPPYPANIAAALSVGDEVVVHTQNGVRSKLVVARIDAAGIHGDTQSIRYSEIERLAVRSSTLPRNLCDDGTPVGCSVPLVLKLSVDRYADYASRFETACADHDYCYRHGHATYGDNRATCDDRFLNEMRSDCDDRFDIDPSARADCLLAAQEFYAAVRQAGEDRFLGNAGSYCEYRGPP